MYTFQIFQNGVIPKPAVPSSSTHAPKVAPPSEKDSAMELGFGGHDFDTYPGGVQYGTMGFFSNKQMVISW